MCCGEINGHEQFHKNSPSSPLKPLTPKIIMLGGSRMMNLGSAGVYLDGKCRTHPSRYLPESKTLVKIRKCRFWDLGGLGGGSRRFRLYRIRFGAAHKSPYHHIKDLPIRENSLWRLSECSNDNCQSEGFTSRLHVSEAPWYNPSARQRFARN